MGSRNPPTFLYISKYSLLLTSFILINLVGLGYNLEFKNKKVSDLSINRNLKLTLKKKAVASLTPHGLIIDRPRVKVLNYRVKNTDPWVITDELNCIGGYCDELIEPGQAPPGSKVIKLGQGDGEIAEWSVPPNVTQVVFECQSRSGPVEWEYDGKGKFPDIDIDNTRQTGDFWTVTTYTHVSKLILKKVSDQLTGTYTCRNVDKPGVLNSFYLFVPQEKLEIYEAGQQIQIIPSKSAAEVIIPCRVTSRQTSVYLYKKLLGDGSLRKINMNNGVHYDPYNGFHVPLSRESFGHYICKIDKPLESIRVKREIALVVTPPAESSTSPGIPAFPTSEEIAEMIAIDKLQKKPSSPIPNSLEKLVEPNTLSQDSASYSQIISSSQGPNQPPRSKRRRKRPFMRRRGGPGPNGMLRRRGGPPPQIGGRNGPTHGPGHPIPRRRLGPFIHFRRPPPPYAGQFGPFHLPPHYQQHLPQGQFGHQAHNTMPVQGHEPNQGPVLPGSQHPYLYPSPIMSHPPPPTPVKILPTFINKHGQQLRPSTAFSSEERFPSSSEINNPISGETNSSLSMRVDGSSKPSKPPRRGAAAIISQNLLPQTMNIMSSMHCVLKKVILGPDAPCNGSLLEPGSMQRRPGLGPLMSSIGFNNLNSKNQDTILEVDVQRSPENKFFPKETLYTENATTTVIYTTVPFFVKWQTRFTDYADWAEVNHTLQDGTYKRRKAGVFEDGINSFEVFDLKEGDSGKISIAYMGSKKEILVHTWKYFIINNTAFDNKGLRRKEDGESSVFTCRSTSANKPAMTLTKFSEDGCPIAERDSVKGFKAFKKGFTEQDCGAGCFMIKTEVEFGIVHCFGDGVDETIRFPSDLYCTKRPYFVDRGKTKNLTLDENQRRLVIPCVINNPNADVYLFHENLNETVQEVTDFATYDLKVGFSLELSKVEDPLGTYVCTSTSDLEDDTDMVTYSVTTAPAYIFHPANDKVFGTPPFKFVWESTEELEIENKSIGNFYSGLFAKPEGNRPHVGTFEIKSLKDGEEGEIKVIKSSNKTVVHTWHYKNKGKTGLWLDRERNVFRCQSTSEEVPQLFAVECSNPNVCNLKKRFIENEDSGRDNSYCGEGCAQLKVWGNKPTGFVKCTGDGVDESLNYFLSENSKLCKNLMDSVTDRDDLDNFKLPEITNVVRKLRIGETTNFVCKASKYFYSKGFQWAIETRNGSKRFVDLKTKDDDSFLNEIRSEISLKVGDQEWKAVWCFVPLLHSNQWANVSQPIYIKM